MQINEKVSVLTIFNADTNKVLPYVVKWNNRKYTITKIGFRHKLNIGTTLHHIFSVTDGNTFFRLNFDTSNLHWTLEEVTDEIET
ncbi:MAG: hypothetical protein M3Q44_05280 [bacterium]|nr:hypothetical protein [bacterium]